MLRCDAGKLWRSPDRIIPADAARPFPRIQVHVQARLVASPIREREAQNNADEWRRTDLRPCSDTVTAAGGDVAIACHIPAFASLLQYVF